MVLVEGHTYRVTKNPTDFECWNHVAVVVKIFPSFDFLCCHLIRSERRRAQVALRQALPRAADLWHHMSPRARDLSRLESVRSRAAAGHSPRRADQHASGDQGRDHAHADARDGGLYGQESVSAVPVCECAHTRGMEKSNNHCVSIFSCRIHFSWRFHCHTRTSVLFSRGNCSIPFPFFPLFRHSVHVGDRGGGHPLCAAAGRLH